MCDEPLWNLDDFDKGEGLDGPRTYMARTGRRSKLTSEVVDKICNALRLGMTYDQAAELAGIGKSTFYRWKEKAEKAKEGKFREFWDSLKRAETEGEAVLLKDIHSTATGKHIRKKTKIEAITDPEGVEIGTKTTTTIEEGVVWQACAWILERRHPERWGRRDRVPESQGKDRFDKWIDDLEDAERKYK